MKRAARRVKVRGVGSNGASLDSASSDGGFTLVELMITMILLGVVGTVMVNIVGTTNKVYLDDTARGDSGVVAATAVARIQSDLLGAAPLQLAPDTLPVPALVSAAENDLTFYSLRNGQATRFRIYVTPDNKLVEDSQKMEKVVTSATGAQQTYFKVAAQLPTRLLSPAITVTATAPLFTYWSGGDINAAPQQISFSGTGSTNIAFLQLVHSISLRLAVSRDPSRGVAPVVLPLRVTPPNLGVMTR